MNSAIESIRREVKVEGTAAYRTKDNRRCRRGGSLKFVQTKRVVTCSALERTGRKESNERRKIEE